MNITQQQKDQLDFAAKKQLYADKAISVAKAKVEIPFDNEVTILDIAPGETEPGSINMPSDGDFHAMGYNISWEDDGDGVTTRAIPTLEMSDAERGRPFSNEPVNAVNIATPGDFKRGGVRFGARAFEYYFLKNSTFKVKVSNIGNANITSLTITWTGKKKLYFSA